MIHITDTTVLNDSEIVERFVRATGARGQNARKEATAVELRFDIRKSSLPPDVQKRLIGLAGRAVTADRVLTVVSRADRSQAKNRDSAHARLLALLRRASTPPNAADADQNQSRRAAEQAHDEAPAQRPQTCAKREDCRLIGWEPGR